MSGTAGTAGEKDPRLFVPGADDAFRPGRFRRRSPSEAAEEAAGFALRRLSLGEVVGNLDLKIERDSRGEDPRGTAWLPFSVSTPLRAAVPASVWEAPAAAMKAKFAANAAVFEFSCYSRAPREETDEETGEVFRETGEQHRASALYGCAEPTEAAWTRLRDALLAEMSEEERTERQARLMADEHWKRTMKR